MLDTILVTKFYIPPARAELVRRPSLIERLNAGLDRKLTLISAPAGFGKTTLVSEWVECVQKTGRVNDRPIKIAWLSLDEADNDPIRFLAYIVTALHQVEGQQDIGQVALSMLQSPQPAPHTSILVSLINDLASIPDEIALVIDDYHLIESEPIHQAVQFLLENIPPQVHLVILSRQDPYLPLSRFRASDQLTELRASDLRFDHAEVAEFLNHVMGLELSEADVVRLESRTEGWIAGLQLAAVSIQGRGDASSRVKAFSGSNRLVLDYLLEEVLEGQPEHVEQFLLQTSILDRLRGPLCDAITGQTDGQATLEMLEDANLFIVPLDDERRWYRYHHLFAGLLRKRLNQKQPAKLPSLHEIASNWYEANELYDHAIDHAIKSGDFMRSAVLMERQADSSWRHGELSKLFGWLEKLPRDILLGRPMLCVYDAWLQFVSGHQEASEESLQAAENALANYHIMAIEDITQGQELGEAGEAGIAGRAATIRAELAFFRGDLPAIDKYAQLALDLLHPDDLSFRSAATATLGDAFSLRGDLANAYKAREQAVKLSEAGNNQYLKLISTMKLAVTLRQMGRLKEIVELFERELQIAEETGMSQTDVFGSIFAIWAEVLAEFGNLDQALDPIKKGMKLAEGGSDVGLIGWSYLCATRIFYSNRDTDSAQDIFQETLTMHQRIGMPPWVMDRMAVWRARIWLTQGKTDEAMRWVQDRATSLEEDISLEYRFEHLILARVLLAQERWDEALSLLQRLLELEELQEHVPFEIELHALHALVLQALGDRDQSLLSLKRAINLANPRGFHQIFVDEGPPMASLLYEALSESIEPEYVQRLLVSFSDAEPEKPHSIHTQTDQSGLIEPLSEREIEVLELIAKGLTNRVIADRLVLSLHTVKAHTRNIYGKLDVHNRTQAVDRARALGILSPL